MASKMEPKTPEERQRESALSAMIRAPGKPLPSGNGPVQEQKSNVVNSLETMAQRNRQDWDQFIASVRDFAQHMRAEAEALERWIGTK